MKNNLEEIEKLEKILSGKYEKSGLLPSIKKYFLILLKGVILSVLRLMEILFAFILLITLGTVLCILLIIRRQLSGRSVFIKENIIGQYGKRITIYYFNFKNHFLRNISLLYYVFTNKLSITGVSIKQYDDINRVLGDAYLYNSKPGLFNLWYIRKSSRITFEGEFNTDWEYVFKKNFIEDILIILKSIPAAFYYFDPGICREKVNIFDLDFDNLTMESAINLLDKTIISQAKKKVFFVNSDCLNKIFSDKEYSGVLTNADYIFPDGIGINIACKMLKDPLLENINGTDMLPYICSLAAEKKYSIFLLGGKPGVAEKMKCNIEAKYQGLKMAGTQDGYFKKGQTDVIINRINSSNADILLVAFGAPLQEKWITENFDKIDCAVQMGVGGLFDFYSGNIKRAPTWMREVGLEWFFRMMQEPKRMWRRYVIGNPIFIYRVLKWKFSRNSRDNE
jgi:N-acetylglucosaminyldiphosphoundecaprenol N-acetyl-beta-D-mannosaminyltransferase